MVTRALLVGLFTSLISMLGCTASVKSGGVCTRSCGSRPVGGAGSRVIPLSSPLTISKCEAGKTLDSQTYYFFVYEEMAADSNSGSTQSNSKSPKRIPKAGIGFVPMVPGFNDIVTRESDQCTDSCGIAEITFKPKCAPQDVSIGILVPGMTYDDGNESIPSTKFTISLE